MSRVLHSAAGKNLSVEIFGGSHEPEIGVEIRGLSPGGSFDEALLRQFLKRRAPGGSDFVTPRKEPDEPVFLSGIKPAAEPGRLTITGEPLRAVIRNRDRRSGDYRTDIPRPAHADFTAFIKYGSEVNMAGGGPFSGRMTAPLCIAGGIALQLLARKGIRVGAHLLSVGAASDLPFDPVSVSGAQLDLLSAASFPVLSPEAEGAMKRVLGEARDSGDSVGGIVECCALSLPAGLGGPLFDGVESALAPLLFAIPAVKGVSFGCGFSAAAMTGSTHNDGFVLEGGEIRPAGNRHGGILGGITSGMPLLLQAAFKPTPSIAKPQQSVSFSERKPVTLTIRGRHDPCVAVRAVPVVEAAVAFGLLDLMKEVS